MFWSERSKSLNAFSSELRGANEGVFPALQLDEIFALLNLDGNEPDGLDFVDRILPPKRILDGFCLTPNIQEIAKMVFGVKRLLKSIHKETATESQIKAAENFVAVIERQLEREGHVCPFLMMVYLEIGFARPNLVKSHVMEVMLTGGHATQ